MSSKLDVVSCQSALFWLKYFHLSLANLLWPPMSMHGRPLYFAGIFSFFFRCHLCRSPDGTQTLLLVQMWAGFENGCQNEYLPPNIWGHKLPIFGDFMMTSQVKCEYFRQYKLMTNGKGYFNCEVTTSYRDHLVVKIAFVEDFTIPTPFTDFSKRSLYICV